MRNKLISNTLIRKIILGLLVTNLCVSSTMEVYAAALIPENATMVEDGDFDITLTPETELEMLQASEGEPVQEQVSEEENVLSSNDVEELAEVDDDPQRIRGLAQFNADSSQGIPLRDIPVNNLNDTVSNPSDNGNADELGYSVGGDSSLTKYNHGKYASKTISKGIDVSQWNGNIDWTKAKADGVDFAFIRAAARGWGDAGKLKVDENPSYGTDYKKNINDAKAAGVKVGVYIFSQATTVAEAEEEADYIINLTKGMTFTLPVIMDFEFADTGDPSNPGRLQKANLTKAEATAVVNAFCARVEASGRTAMLYADYNMLTNHLNASQISDKYKIWIARWNTETKYSGDYSFWQFSDNGQVNGITGTVDLDFGYEEGIVDPVTPKDSIVLSVNDLSGEQGDVDDRDVPSSEGTRAEQLAQIPTGFWTSAIEEQTYTSRALKPEVRVYFGKNKLTLNKDYSLTYKNNVNVGTATVTIKGKGNYSGTYTTEFKIIPYDITPEVEQIEGAVVPYNATKSQSQPIALKINGKKLALGKDYTVITKNASGSMVSACQSSGVYTVTVRGCGNYTGGETAPITFTILREDAIHMNRLTVSGIAKSYACGRDAKPIEPEPQVSYQPDKNSAPITLTKGVDYEITYKNNDIPGTASLILKPVQGNTRYGGTKTVKFKITGMPINKAKVASLESYVYTGSAIEPVPQVVYTTETGDITLQKNTDYDITYKNNIKAGNATLILRGKGAFTGTLKKTFKIEAFGGLDSQNLSSHIFIEHVNLSANSVKREGGKTIPEYGYIKGGVTPEIRVYYDPAGTIKSSTTSDTIPESAVLLTKGSDYTVKYSSNKAVAQYNDVDDAGKSIAPAIIVTGKKTFKGSVTSPFSIVKRDISQMQISVADKVASTQKGKYATSIVITDPYSAANNKLIAGTDYSKDVEYTYAEDTAIKRYNTLTGSDEEVLASKGSAVSASDIIPAGTTIGVKVTGTGFYTGEIKSVYEVAKYDISKATVSIVEQRYTGKPIEPGKSGIATINYNINGKNVPIDSANYEIVGYKNNISKGTATMIIHGLGDFCGTKNVTFKILGKSLGYSVVFSANGGTGTMKEQIILISGTSLKAAAFKRAGYEFKGWNTTWDGSGTSYTDGQTIANVSWGGALTLYAQWKPITYTITYVPGNDKAVKPTTNPTTYTVETPDIELQLCSISGVKLKQLGWYTDSGCTKAVTRIVKGTTGNLTLYGDWIEDYDIVQLGTQPHTQAQVKSYISKHPTSNDDSYKVSPVTSGSSKKVGVLSDKTITSSLNAINNIRYMAGLGEVTEDPEQSNLASAATFLNYKNNQLSHYPQTPSDMEKTDSIVVDGRLGARSSNLAWTSWSGSMRYAIDLWMNDSDSSNVDRVGHRRWILNPAMGKIGFGRTEGYYAMYAFDTSAAGTTEVKAVNGVAWPAQNTKTSYFTSGSVWSLSTGRNISDKANVKIIITDKKTGKKYKLKPAYVDNAGYGMTGCVIFKPSVSTSAGSGYKVSVFLHDTEEEFQYEVNFF